MKIRACAFGSLLGLWPIAIIEPSVAQSVSAVQPMTLADAMALAYESNPQLAQARAALQALDQGVAQADAGWRPSVNASISQGYDHGIISGFPSPLDSQPTIGEVSISQPIFRGGRTDAEISRATAQVHAGRAQLIATEQTVLLAAVTAYMDVVRDTADLRFNQDNVRSLEDQLKDVHTELSAGAVTRTDVFESEARLARARGDLAVAQSRVVASLAAFENAVGRSAGSLAASVSLPHIIGSKEMALDLALKQNPDLDQAKANERVANYGIDDAIGALMPSVSVSGQYQYLLNAPNASIFAIGNPQQVLSVVVQANVPIYQGGADEATVRRARDVDEQADMALAVAERGVRQNVETAWQEFDAARSAIAAYQGQVSADQDAVNGVKQEQEAGERSVIDILNAQQELFVTQVALTAAQHDEIVASYRLLSIAGELTARAQGLKVTLYDPEVHYNENADNWFGFGK